MKKIMLIILLLSPLFSENNNIYCYKKYKENSKNFSLFMRNLNKENNISKESIDNYKICLNKLIKNECFESLFKEDKKERKKSAERRFHIMKDTYDLMKENNSSN